MRIPSIESELSQTRNQGLDPKVLTLLEKLNSQPLLIQKLLMSERNALTLNTSNSPLLTQLRLPLSSANDLTALTQTAAQITVKTLNNQLMLQITPVDPQANKSFQAPPIQLLFKQAQIVSGTVIQLGQPVRLTSKSTAQNSNLTSQPTATASTEKKSPSSQVADNRQGSATTLKSQENQKSVSLKQTVEQFLKARPIQQKSIGPSLSNLVKTAEQFVNHLNSFSNNTTAATKITLNTNALTELLVKLQSFSTPDKPVTSLHKLTQSLNELKQLLDFSPQNRKLNINSRLKSSGHFFESRLAQNLSDLAGSKTPVSKVEQGVTNKSSHPPQHQSSTINHTTTNARGQEKANSERQAVQQATPKDIKLLSLQIRQALQTLVKHASSPAAKPLQTLTLATNLAQQASFQQALTAPLPVSADENSMPPNPASFNDTIATQAKLLFQSKALQNFPWRHHFTAANQATSPRIDNDALILNTQRQLLTDMLNEVNATLNKIETNQLLNLRAEASQLQHILGELPIYRAGQVDSFELLFESEENANEKSTTKSWVVTIRFDLEPLGPMFARVSLKGERISTHFFAENKTTAKLLTENMQHLETSLFAAGLDVDEVQGQQGIVPQELTRNEDRRVDLRV